MSRSIIDICGQRFGRLFVLRVLPDRDKYGAALWKCRCDCGNHFIARGISLRNGGSKSCGCLRREVLSVAGPLRAAKFRELVEACT